MSRVSLYIDLKKVQENYLEIVRNCSDCIVMPVLKANAYGLGASTIAKCLQDVGAKHFGVADVTEAFQVRPHVDHCLLLGSMLPQELKFLNSDLTVSISSFTEASRFSTFAMEHQCTLKAHILIDSGMGRLGLLVDDAYEEIIKIASLPNLKLEGLFSHFSSANCDEEFSLIQLSKVSKLISMLKSRDVFFDYIHIANSDGINNIKSSFRSPFNMVRSGINLFGVFDNLGKHRLKLGSVLSLKSQLVAKRFLRKGTAIGYSQSYILPQDTWVGTVPIGYADGVPQNLSGKAYFYIGEEAFKIIGKVSMDYTMIDLGEKSKVQIGDIIDILRGTKDIVNWANIKGTIPYDIICSIGNRVQRIYES